NLVLELVEQGPAAHRPPVRLVEGVLGILRVGGAQLGAVTAGGPADEADRTTPGVDEDLEILAEVIDGADTAGADLVRAERRAGPASSTSSAGSPTRSSGCRGFGRSGPPGRRTAPG